MAVRDVLCALAHRGRDAEGIERDRVARVEQLRDVRDHVEVEEDEAWRLSRAWMGRSVDVLISQTFPRCSPGTGCRLGYTVVPSERTDGPSGS